MKIFKELIKIILLGTIAGYIAYIAGGSEYFNPYPEE